MESGISVGMKVGRLFRRVSSAVASLAGSVKVAAQNLLAVNENTAQQDQRKWNRRQRRAYRSWLGRRFKSNISGTKLQRKAYLHKLCGRTSRLIQRFVREQQKRILAKLQAELAAGKAV